MRYENLQEIMAATQVYVGIGTAVKITKGKRAKIWRVLGIDLPLPLMGERGGGSTY
jgi:hypothetical protein